jgi:hypothetical protein
MKQGFSLLTLMIISSDAFARGGADYTVAASAQSKAASFLFIGTFIYLIVTTGISTGIFGGLLFFIIGIFAVSLLIAAPLFLLKVSFPKLRLFIIAAEWVMPVSATYWTFYVIFS